MYNLPCCRNPRVVRWLKAEVSLPTPLAPGGVDGGVRIVSIRRPEHVEPISLNEPPLEPLRIFLRSLQRCGSCRELGAEGGEFGFHAGYFIALKLKRNCDRTGQVAERRMFLPQVVLL